MAFTWGDPAKQYADFTMSQVQSMAGSTPDGRRRDQSPYYVFGALETTQTPPTRLPAIQWAQGDGHFDHVRVTPGNGTTGSLGSWMLDMEVKIVGNNRAEVYDEMMFLQWAIFGLQHPNPPISNFKQRWDGQLPLHSRKETAFLTFTVPVLLPMVPTTVASITAISASFAEAALTGSLLPNITGSYPSNRTVVVR